MSERYLKDILQDIGYDFSKTLVLYDNYKNLVRHSFSVPILLHALTPKFSFHHELGGF